MPRLGATFDVKGDGKWVLQGDLRPLRGQGVRDPVRRQHERRHPEPRHLPVPRARPGQGIGFAPGFDLANYRIIGGSFPVRNVFLDDDLKTPITKEWTLQAGTRLGNRGEIKAVYTHRKTTNFLDDFITIDNGKTTVTDGRPSTSAPSTTCSSGTPTTSTGREYQAPAVHRQLPGHRRLGRWARN